MKIGYVYILDLGNKVKIGSSTQPSKRVSVLSKVRNPRFRVWGPIPDYMRRERQIHYLLKQFAMGGEMFKIPFNSAVWLAWGGLV
jgi:hypothetical protein